MQIKNTPRKPKNTLAFPDMIKVSDWVREHATTFDGLSHPEICAKASAALGFTVSESTLSLVKKTFGLEWKTAKGRTAPSAEQQREFQMIIVGQLNVLIEALGEEKTPGFARLVKQMQAQFATDLGA